MRRIALSVFLILSACVISSCSSNAADEATTTALNSIADTTSAEKESDTSETEAAKSSDSVSTDIGVDTSADFIHLNELGVYQLAENDIIWKKYFYGEYTFKSEYMPETIRVNGNTYIELSLAARDDVCNLIKDIQEAFGTDLILSDDGEFYFCPFTSIQDLKKYMQGTYSESSIDYFLGYMTVIEYDGSLYIPDAGGVSPSREVTSVTILEESDTGITFSVGYKLLPVEGVNLNVKYSAVCRNGNWVLDRIENV